VIAVKDARYGHVFWVGLVLGWAIIGFGVWGVIHTRAQAVPVALTAWLVGAAIVHDFLVAPVVFAVGIALRRSLKGRIRVSIQAGLLVSGVVLAYSFPLLLGYGRRPSNPTVQPNDYVVNVVVVLAAIWTAGFVWLLAGAHRARRGSR